MSKLIKIGKAAELLGVSIDVLRNSRELKVWKTPGGHRMYYLSDVLALKGSYATDQSNEGNNMEISLEIRYTAELDDLDHKDKVVRNWIKQIMQPLHESSGYAFGAKERQFTFEGITTLEKMEQDLKRNE